MGLVGAAQGYEENLTTRPVSSPAILGITDLVLHEDRVSKVEVGVAKISFVKVNILCRICTYSDQGMQSFCKIIESFTEVLIYNTASLSVRVKDVK